MCCIYSVVIGKQTLNGQKMYIVHGTTAFVSENAHTQASFYFSLTVC